MTRSVPLVLLILSAVFIFTTCATHHPMMVPPSGPCSPGTYNPNAPIVCIDDSDLSRIAGRPDPAKVYAGATIHFWTDSGNGTLSITSSTLPAESIKCLPGGAHCFAKIRKDAPKGAHKYYAVITRDGRVGVSPDPTVIIDTQ